MQNIEDYIADRYSNDIHWFEQEVNQSNHVMRVSNVINNKNYLLGHHKILEREDSKWKGKEYVTKKLILQQAKLYSISIQLICWENRYLLAGQRIKLKYIRIYIGREITMT